VEAVEVAEVGMVLEVAVEVEVLEATKPQQEHLEVTQPLLQVL
jgi:hypothetical protein